MRKLSKEQDKSQTDVAIEEVQEIIARARRRSSGTAPTMREWAAALIASKGLQVQAARLIGASFNTLKRALAESADLQGVLAEARESLLDQAESALYTKAITEKDGESLRYLLKQLGRSRGYGEKIEATVEVVDGSAVVAKLRAKLANG